MAVTFRRCELYKETYMSRIKPYPVLKGKLRQFMEFKRNNPNQMFGASDKPFLNQGFFTAAVPGIKHAHLNQDLSIVYKVDGSVITLYGMFTHDDLGTGQPANIRKQKSMAQRLSNEICS